MKVLLFVQAGNARPKCMGRCHESVSRVRGPVFYELRPAGIFGRKLYVGVRAGRAKNLAARWWLVACANADEGRMIIGCCPGDDSRILAQGGRP